jgi:hypothetical protein
VGNHQALVDRVEHREVRRKLVADGTLALSGAVFQLAGSGARS